MQRTPLVILVGLLVGLSVLAGCITSATTPPDGSGSASVGNEETDAVTHLAAARAAAATWGDNATLLAIAGTEGAPLQAVDPPMMWDTSADPNVGNGLAIVWTYVFGAVGQEKVLFVSINGAGETVYSQALHHPAFNGYCCYAIAVDDGAPEPDTATTTSYTEPSRCCYTEPYHPALSDPTVGSGDAAIAAATNESFRDFGTLHPVHGVTVFLTPGASPEGVWQIGKSTATVYSVHVGVDGKTGNVTHVHESPYYYGYPEPPCCCCEPPCCDEPEPWAPEDFSAEYTASTWAFGPSMQFSFPVDYAPAAKKVQLDLTATGVDLEAMRARVLDAHGGELARFETVPGELELEGLRTSGTYTVILEPRNTDFFVFEHTAHLEVDVDYEPVPYASTPPDLDITYLGEVQGFPGHEQYYNIPLEAPTRELTVTLDYDADLGAGRLALRIYDWYGNVLMEQMGPGTLTLADPDPWGGYSASVVLQSVSLTKVDYTVTAKAVYEPWETRVHMAEDGGAPHSGHGEHEHKH